MNHQAFLDLASSRDTDAFQKRLVTFADDLGFPLVSAILVLDRPAQESLFLPVGNTPADYESTFSDADVSRRCPVMRRLKVFSRPIVYDQELYVGDGVGYQWEHQASYGYKTGIAMAQHMPGGKHFLLGVDREDDLPEDGTQLTRLMADLQLLGAFAQETAVRLLTPQAEADPGPALSPRELEILRWTGDGKSASVIGELLGIGTSTVNYHLRCAEEKLRVAGKHQAVVKAMRLGLL